MNAHVLLELIAGRPLLTRADVMRRFSVGKSTLAKWRAAGFFPRPIYIHGPRWRPLQIEQWERALVAMAAPARKRGNQPALDRLKKGGARCSP